MICFIFKLTSFFSALSFADTRPPFPTLGEPILDGAGCAPGTLQFVLSPDESALSVIFDDYRVEAGQGVPEATRHCIALVPLEVPPGMFLHLVKVDYRGYNFLPAGAEAKFVTHYSFQGAGEKPQKRVERFKGPLNEEFTDTDFERIRSKCGGSNVLRISTRLMIQTNPQLDDAFSQVDTVDLTTPHPPKDRRKPNGKKKNRKAKYYFKLKPCNEPDPPADP